MYAYGGRGASGGGLDIITDTFQSGGGGGGYPAARNRSEEVLVEVVVKPIYQEPVFLAELENM